MRGSSSSAWASSRARPGSPGSSARSASGAVGRTWRVAGATVGRIGSAPVAKQPRAAQQPEAVRAAEAAGQGPRERQDRAESVRAAAAQAVAAAAGQAQTTRDRAQGLADEVAGAAQKLTRERAQELADELAGAAQRVGRAPGGPPAALGRRGPRAAPPPRRPRPPRRRPGGPAAGAPVSPAERRDRLSRGVVPGPRVLVTGVASPWGAALARRLAADGDVAHVVGLDDRPVPHDLGGATARVEVVTADLRSPGLGAVVAATGADVVVHDDLLQFPEPGRPARALHDLNVVGTLQLLAALEAPPAPADARRAGLGRRLRLRAGRRPPSSPRTWPGARPPRTRFQRDVAELEHLVDGFARRHPRRRARRSCASSRSSARGLDTPITRLVRAAGRPDGPRLRPAGPGPRRRGRRRRPGPGGPPPGPRRGQRRRARRRVAQPAPAPPRAALAARGRAALRPGRRARAPARGPAAAAAEDRCASCATAAAVSTARMARRARVPRPLHDGRRARARARPDAGGAGRARARGRGRGRPRRELAAARRARGGRVGLRARLRARPPSRSLDLLYDRWWRVTADRDRARPGRRAAR